MNIPSNLTQEQAIKLAESNWWETKTDYELVRFQLFESRLCMPFSRFHEAIEKVLDRSIFTHEFGLNYEGLVLEFLGEKEAPTMDEIINLIPEDKRILINL